MPLTTPILLTTLYIHFMIIKLTFLIFVSSMWYLLNLRNKKDLLTLKLFGYSNFKIFLILANYKFYSWMVCFILLLNFFFNGKIL